MVWTGRRNSFVSTNGNFRVLGVKRVTVINATPILFFVEYRGEYIFPEVGGGGLTVGVPQEDKKWPRSERSYLPALRYQTRSRTVARSVIKGFRYNSWKIARKKCTESRLLSVFRFGGKGSEVRLREEVACGRTRANGSKRCISVIVSVAENFRDY